MGIDQKITKFFKGGWVDIGDNLQIKGLRGQLFKVFNKANEKGHTLIGPEKTLELIDSDKEYKGNNLGILLMFTKFKNLRVGDKIFPSFLTSQIDEYTGKSITLESELFHKDSGTYMLRHGFIDEVPIAKFKAKFKDSYWLRAVHSNSKHLSKFPTVDGLYPLDPTTALPLNATYVKGKDKLCYLRFVGKSNALYGTFICSPFLGPASIDKTAQEKGADYCMILNLNSFSGTFMDLRKKG